MMRFKTDENLHPDVSRLLQMAGHDVTTVWEQQLRGAQDRSLIDICNSEQRALITLDLDFADIRAYPPEQYAGIIVMRLANQSRAHVVQAIGRVAPLLENNPLAGRLWIVDEATVRVRGGS